MKKVYIVFYTAKDSLEFVVDRVFEKEETAKSYVKERNSDPILMGTEFEYLYEEGVLYH